MSADLEAPLPVVIAIGNFDYSGGFRFRSTTIKRFEGEYPADFRLRPGDLLLAMTCQTPDGAILGVPGRVPDDGVTYLHNQRLGKVVPLDERLDLGFMFHLARWSEFKRHLFATSSGSKILHTSPTRIEDFEFGLPPLHEQRGIAAVLSTLDDKIQFESRITEVITELIRSCVEEATSRDSESTRVSDLAQFTNGGAYTKGASGTGRMVVRIAELNDGPGPSTVYNDIDVPEERVVRAGDLLMSWSGSLGAYRWSRDEAIVNQHIFKVDPGDYPAWLVFDRIDYAMSTFRRVASDKATTMGHIQRGHLDSTHVPLPNANDLGRLQGVFQPLWQRLLLADRQIHTVGRLRDALLPELLSGRLRTPAADTVT